MYIYICLYTAVPCHHFRWGCLRCGWGNWHKVRACILASPRFTFDYYLRSLSETALGKHCEQLMKSSEKYLLVSECQPNILVPLVECCRAYAVVWGGGDGLVATRWCCACCVTDTERRTLPRARFLCDGAIPSCLMLELLLYNSDTIGVGCCGPPAGADGGSWQCHHNRQRRPISDGVFFRVVVPVLFWWARDFCAVLCCAVLCRICKTA